MPFKTNIHTTPRLFSLHLYYLKTIFFLFFVLKFRSQDAQLLATLSNGGDVFKALAARYKSIVRQKVRHNLTDKK